MSRRMLVVAALLGGAFLVAILLAIDLQATRAGLAVVGCLLLPGLGWARKMHYADLGDTLALASVLSICMTVAVGTTMVLSRSWSLAWGLAALGGLALVGFVPARLLLDRASAAVQLRIAGFSDDGGAWAEWYRQTQDQARARALAATSASEAAAVWVDWYADVERRAEEGRAREAAAKEAAIEAWIAWYQQTHLLTKRSDQRN
jgi:hypothetical protein